MEEQDSRYPYTYACDLIRSFAGYSNDGTKLSRADASKIRQGIAKALGIPDEILAKALANYYKENEQALTENSVRAAIVALGLDCA